VNRHILSEAAKPGVNTIGTRPEDDIVLPAGAGVARVGRLTYEGGRVWLDLEPRVAATTDAGPIAGRLELGLADAASGRPAARVTVGRVTFHLHASGNRLAERVRDPESPLLKAFTGRRWFQVDPRWAVTGQFLPLDRPVTVAAQNVLGDNTPTTSPGEVEFALDGTTHRLLAYTTRARTSMRWWRLCCGSGPGSEDGNRDDERVRGLPRESRLRACAA
jgi:uncharacterized protein